MPISPHLQELARYLAGEFDNREQAIAEPVWYVHLRLWQRPVPLFSDDSVTLFAEQANVLYSDQPYRQRLMRLRQPSDLQAPLHVQYYSFQDPTAVSGAGCQPDRLQKISEGAIDLLPGCVLQITQPQPGTFIATPPTNSKCFFTYQGEKRQVALGFEAKEGTFASYDKGIDIETGRAIWGAIMGPYRFIKRQDFSQELWH